MHLTHIPADTRRHIKQGWLEGWYSFSFADWHDPERVHFGALRVLNDDIIAPANGFGFHPHMDMEIVTVVLAGTLSHRDNTGGSGELRPGDVQVMTAGKGIIHSEVNNSATEEVRSLQLWFYPRAISQEPRYDQAFLPVEDGQQRVLVSGDGTPGVLQVAQDMRVVRIKLLPDEPQSYVPMPGNGQYLFVIEGAGNIAGQKVERRDAVAITGGGPIELLAEDGVLDLLLLDVPMLD